MSRYDEIYARAHNQPELFWEEAAEEIHWYKKWDKVLDRSNPPFYRWFPGGAVNTCYDALDRHIDEKGHGDRLALIYDSPVTDKLRRFSYAELRQEVALFCRCFKQARRWKRRSCVNLYAYGASNRSRDACKRAHRRHSLSCIRWICCA